MANNDPGGELSSPDISLTASTGKNDSNSPWGSGGLQFASDLLKQGTGIYQAVTGKGSSKAPAAAAPIPAASGSTWTKYLPYAIGGVVLLLVVGLVFRK